MNKRILNRDGQLPDDGWYQFEAAGEHINHSARVIQVIDDKAITSIVNRFMAEAKDENFAGQRIDKDHLSQVVIDKELVNSTESLGWAMELRNRAGVPEAKIDWTILGRPLIESQPGKPPVYKFFSTEYEPTECEPLGTRVINKKTYTVLRPLRLDGLSLTNDPNNKGQRPISNRSGGDESQPTSQPMKTLLKKLGLAEDASEESGLAALDKIMNRATTAESNVLTLTTERDGLLTVQVEADLEKFKGVITNRENVKKALITNRKGTIELLEGLKPAEVVVEDPKRITNRQSARTPEQIAADKETDKAEARAAKISNRARSIRAQKPTVTLNDAYATATAEVDAESAK